MKKTLFFLFLLSFSFILKSQIKERVYEIPVTANGENLSKTAWCGGFNNPIFSTIDFNNDGLEDLFVFDKNGNAVATFLNNGSTTSFPYEYAPQYERLFPSSLYGWAVIRDYNKDGVGDIFTLTNGGIKVYRGSRVAGELNFTLVKDELRYPINGGTDHIWTFIDDLPGFVDVNHDGDLDVLVFNILGGSAVEYYENQAVENGQSLDSLNFEFLDACWGRFSESSLNNNVFLANCKRGGKPTSGSSASRHQGGTLFTFDYEEDRDVDVLIGDVSYNSLIFLQNGGDSSYANMTYKDTTFPKYDTVVNMQVFPSAFYIDGDNDGRKDLWISSFYYSFNDQGLARDNKNVMFYKNEGLAENKFHYQRDNFLVDNAIDVGSDAKVKWIDYNNDSLQDLVVSNHSMVKPGTISVSSMRLYENIGTRSAPAFSLVDENWNNLKAYGMLAANPAFGDVNGDGKYDMIVGDNFGRLSLFLNNGTQATPFPAMTQSFYDTIDVGEYAAPFLFDINDDQLLDLVIGRKDGKISYYWNFGTATSPLFHKDSVNAFFGNIRVNDVAIGVLVGNAAPFVQNEGNKKYLYSGCERGFVFKYEINKDSLRKGTFLLVDSNVIGERKGFRSSFQINDLNHDGKADYLLGNSRGGVLFYSDSSWFNTTGISTINTLQDAFLLFPNPAKNFTDIRIVGEHKLNSLAIYNAIGESIMKLNDFQQSTIRINTIDWQEGFYIIQLTNDSYTSTKKLLITK